VGKSEDSGAEAAKRGQKGFPKENHKGNSRVPERSPNQGNLGLKLSRAVRSDSQRKTMCNMVGFLRERAGGGQLMLCICHPRMNLDEIKQPTGIIECL